MTIWPLVMKGIDLGFDLAQRAMEWNDARLAKKRAAEKWAATPAVVRDCPKCHEIAYAPGQVYCRHCGAKL